MIYSILLVWHIGAGFVSLLAAFGAVLSKAAHRPHRWHVQCGRIFFGGMTFIFLTAVPMTLLKPNPFLLMVAIFSFYLVLSGWRAATNREGTPSLLDWSSAGLMLLTAGAMILWGTRLLQQGETQGVTLIVFGAIGGLLSGLDGLGFRAGGLKGKPRIARHLTMMLAATIAATTAFLVVNWHFEPAFVIWLLPTVLLSPVIAWWNQRVLRGKADQALEVPPASEP